MTLEKLFIFMLVFPSVKSDNKLPHKVVRIQGKKAYKSIWFHSVNESVNII